MQGNSKNWTLTHIFKASFADLRRHPVGTLLLMGILPSIWMSAVDLLLSPILSERFPPHVFRFAIGLAQAAWGSAFLGGTFLVALAVARGGSPRFFDLIRGIRFTFGVAVVSIINVLATSLIPLVRDTYRFGLGMLLLLALATVLSFVVYIRCSVSVLIIVDRGLGAWWAIPESWMMTRGYLWRIALTYGATSLVALLALLVLRGAFGARLFGAMVDPVITLAMAHIYIRITPLRLASSNTGEASVS